MCRVNSGPSKIQNHWEKVKHLSFSQYNMKKCFYLLPLGVARAVHVRTCAHHPFVLLPLLFVSVSSLSPLESPFGRVGWYLMHPSIAQKFAAALFLLHWASERTKGKRTHQHLSSQVREAFLRVRGEWTSWWERRERKVGGKRGFEWNKVQNWTKFGGLQLLSQFSIRHFHTVTDYITLRKWALKKGLIVSLGMSGPGNWGHV